MGPGSKDYLTSYSIDIIKKSRFIIGYKYTLNTIKHLLDRSYHQIFEITMKSQEDVYLNVFNNLMNENDLCAVPFTGDANFSESEVVDRLLDLFGDNNVEIIPGISSIQIASAKSRVPLDKANIITFHVTGDIEEKKIDLIKSIIDKRRPWPTDQSKNFMPAEISSYVREKGIDTSTIDVWVFENLTNNEKETMYKGKLDSLTNKKFNDLSVMVIDQNKRQTYLDF